MKKLTFAEMQEMQANQLGFMNKMSHEGGGLTHVKILWMEMFFVSEPALMRELLIKHSKQMNRDPFVSRVFKRIMGNGVFISEGETWKKQRKLVQPAFHAMRINQYSDVMADYSRDMVAQWSDGSVIDINQALVQLTLRIIAKTMYDVDLAEQVAEIGDTMLALLNVVEEQLKSTFLPPAWVPTKNNRQHNKLLSHIHDLLRQIISQRKAENEDHGDLLSMLLNVRDEDGQPMPEKQVLDECVTMFVAGHETTAVALTWAWYLLSRHPKILAELKDEVDIVLQGEPIRFEKLGEMPMLSAVVKETLRLYPPAFGFGRTVMEPFAANGIEFPKKGIIMFDIFSLHRRADLFDEPEAFRPDRFLDPENQPDRYSYMPFGAGPRVCLGNMFAMLEAQVILATMLQHVDLAATTDNEAILDTVITLRPRDPLMLKVSLRNLTPQLAK